MSRKSDLNTRGQDATHCHWCKKELTDFWGLQNRVWCPEYDGQPKSQSPRACGFWCGIRKSKFNQVRKTNGKRA